MNTRARALALRSSTESVRDGGKGRGIRITVERNTADAKQFVMQTSHREKNVLFEGRARESVDRSFLAEQTFDDGIYVNADARARERSRSYFRTRENMSPENSIYNT